MYAHRMQMLGLRDTCLTVKRPFFEVSGTGKFSRPVGFAAVLPSPIPAPSGDEVVVVVVVLSAIIIINVFIYFSYGRRRLVSIRRAALILFYAENTNRSLEANCV